MKQRLYVPLLVLLAGCANDPIVDMKGVNPGQYRQDLAECRTYADQVKPGAQAVKGAAGGAAVGGLIGAAVSDSDAAKRVAGAGAVTGAVRGAARAEQRKERVLYNCLRQRGYKVLG